MCQQERDHSQNGEEHLRQLEVIEGLSIDYETICYVDVDADRVTPYRLSRRTAVLFSPGPPDQSYSRYAARYVQTWVHPDDREMVANATSPGYIREKFSDSLTYYFNYRVVMDGEVHYLQLRVVNVGHGDGLCQAVLGYRQVDEEIRRQMEQQTLLAEALEKANSAISTKNTFLSNMSHDMRTPLHAIFGFTSLAKLNLDDPAQATGYLEQVEEASRRLLGMIEKVLEMSDLADHSDVREEECDLREIARHIYDFLQPQAQEKDITFHLDCDGLRHSAVYADQQKLRQLLLYLVNNAVTYTNPGGQVLISAVQGAELPNGCAVYHLSVEDTGIGISPEYLERVYEPFSRERNTTLSGVHGMGLGLTIAKNLVDMMGGSIEIQSVVNQGTTFTVTLTLRVQPRDDAPQSAPGASDAALHILMAEDNDINREIAQELLGQLGFVVDAVEDGLQAVERMERSDPGYYNVILMDLQMPVMDGWQAAKAIRALPDPALASTPIIALSANVLENDRQRSKQSGINVHLSKPMDMPVLLRTIEELTGRRLPS